MEQKHCPYDSHVSKTGNGYANKAEQSEELERNVFNLFSSKQKELLQFFH